MVTQWLENVNGIIAEALAGVEPLRNFDLCAGEIVP